MLRREGPQEWFHDENSNISTMQFQFKDKGSPLDYVYRLSAHMIVSYIFYYLHLLFYVILSLCVCLEFQIRRCINI